jgi:hypothetical protein
MSIASGYVVGGGATVLALPVYFALRRMGRFADTIVGTASRRAPCAAQGLPDVAAVDTRSRIGADAS